LALVPKLILKARELCSGQFGQPPDDLLYHLPPAPIVYVDTMMMYAGSGRSDPVPSNSQHGAGYEVLIGRTPSQACEQRAVRPAVEG
jgi:hypothetical protein